MAGSNNGDFGNIARQWLRAKKTELLTGNRRRREAAELETSDAEQQATDLVVGQAMLSAFPQLRRMQQRQQAVADDREQRERAEVLALPRARLAVQAVGDQADSGVVDLPIRIERDDDFRLEVITLDDAVPYLGRQPFYGCQLRIPDYAGPGSYDLAQMARRAEAAGDPYDYVDWFFALGSLDEGYFWTPETGPALVEIAPDERSIRARMSMQGAGGDLDVSLEIHVLPN